MLVVEKFSFSKNPLRFLLVCPHCGHTNAEKYWVKFLICQKCGKISLVPEEFISKMVKLFDMYGNPAEIF